MNKELCKEIQNRVVNYIAPSMEEHPGVVELSRVWRLWHREASQEEIEKCLDKLKIKTKYVFGEKLYIFTSTVQKSLKKIEFKSNELTEQIKNNRTIIMHLKKEVLVLNNVKELWFKNWELDASQEKTVEKNITATILSFLHVKFNIISKKLENKIEKIRNETNSHINKKEKLEAIIDNLVDFLNDC